MTVTWKYDKHKSHIEKWRVKYTVKGTSDFNHIDTTSADVLHLTIGSLSAGRNYRVTVYGVIYNDVISQEAPMVHATVGQYFIRKNTLSYFALIPKVQTSNSLQPVSYYVSKSVNLFCIFSLAFSLCMRFMVQLLFPIIIV